MYKDDIKLFLKKETELETLIQAVNIHSDDIWMEFAMLKMKNGKQCRTEEIEPPNEEKSEGSEKQKVKNTWKYWKRTQSNKWRWKKKLKGYPWRTRKLLETKLNCRNLNKCINTCAVSLVRISISFFNWTTENFNKWTQEQEN